MAIVTQNKSTANRNGENIRIVDVSSRYQFSQLDFLAPWKQAKSEGFDCRRRPNNLLNLDSNRRFFHFGINSVKAQLGSKSPIFCPVWPWHLMDDLKNSRTPLLCYFKLCASFQSHRWIQTGVTVRKRSIRVKIGYFLSCVTIKFDRWLWKKNRAPPISHIKLCASFHRHMWI